MLSSISVFQTCSPEFVVCFSRPLTFAMQSPNNRQCGPTLQSPQLRIPIPRIQQFRDWEYSQHWFATLVCPRHRSCFRSPAHIVCDRNQREMAALVMFALIQPSADVQPCFPYREAWPLIRCAVSVARNCRCKCLTRNCRCIPASLALAFVRNVHWCHVVVEVGQVAFRLGQL